MKFSQLRYVLFIWFQIFFISHSLVVHSGVFTQCKNTFSPENANSEVTRVVGVTEIDSVHVKEKFSFKLLKGSTSGYPVQPNFGEPNVEKDTNNPGPVEGSKFFGTHVSIEIMMGGKAYSRNEINLWGMALTNTMWKFNTESKNWFYVRGCTYCLNIANVQPVYPPSAEEFSSSAYPSGRWNFFTKKVSARKISQEVGDFQVLFGGEGVISDQTLLLNGLWIYDYNTEEFGFFKGASYFDEGNEDYNRKNSISIQQMEYNVQNLPSGRSGVAGFSRFYVDSKNDWMALSLIIFGGTSYFGESIGLTNQIWEYNIASNQFRLRKGSFLMNDIGYIGRVKGVYDDKNNPPATEHALMWTVPRRRYNMSTLDYDAIMFSSDGVFKYNLPLNKWTHVSITHSNRMSRFGNEGQFSSNNNLVGGYGKHGMPIGIITLNDVDINDPELMEIHKYAQTSPNNCSGRGVCQMGRCFCMGGRSDGPDDDPASYKRDVFIFDGQTEQFSWMGGGGNDVNVQKPFWDADGTDEANHIGGLTNAAITEIDRKKLLIYGGKGINFQGKIDTLDALWEVRVVYDTYWKYNVQPLDDEYENAEKWKILRYKHNSVGVGSSNSGNLQNIIVKVKVFLEGTNNITSSEGEMVNLILKKNHRTLEIGRDIFFPPIDKKGMSLEVNTNLNENDTLEVFVYSKNEGTVRVFDEPYMEIFERGYLKCT